MKGIWHLLTSTLILTVLCIIIEELTITIILVALPFTLFPDVDFKFGTHRNVAFHSIIVWGIVWVFNPSLLTAVMVFGVGLHLLEDITLNKHKWRGGYVIKLYKKGLFRFWKGKQGVLSTLFLLGNFIVSVIILIVQLYITG